MRSVAMILVLLAAFLAPARPAFSDIQILDSSDVRDWARVPWPYHWKDKDTILRPNALLKFDLGDLPADALVRSAVLEFYAERSDPGGTVSVNHVRDDSWSFLRTDPASLYNWPIENQIEVYPTGTPGWHKVDVTTEVKEELLSPERVLSIKWQEESGTSSFERITSPSYREYEKRPRLMVDYFSTLPVLLPDLTLGPPQILPTRPPRKFLVRAEVVNNGPAAADNVRAVLYDGHPSDGGVKVGRERRIGSITGGGGSAEVTWQWRGRPGTHRLYVLVDPRQLIEELDEANNSDFSLLEARSNYARYSEGFENELPAESGTVTWAGAPARVGAWVADADVPHDPNISLARQWQIAPVSTEAYSGHRSLLLYLDGRSDDGTIWIERAVPVPPQSDLTADLRFAFGKEPDIATAPVYYLGLSDPEVELDFNTLPLQDGWQVYNASVPISTGNSTVLWVAVGLTVSWETEVYHYLDEVEVILH